MARALSEAGVRPDMIFGTFRNPREWQGENGFHPGSTRQIGALLVFRKIS